MRRHNMETVGEREREEDAKTQHGDSGRKRERRMRRHNMETVGEREREEDAKTQNGDSGRERERDGTR